MKLWCGGREMDLGWVLHAAPLHVGISGKNNFELGMGGGGGGGGVQS